jgi:D-alanine-D-alanine ligase
LTDRLKVGVLFGGRSGEHEISLMSTRSVIGAMDPEKYEVIPIGITHAGRWLYGDGALEQFEQGATDTLQPVLMLGEPGQKTLYRRLEGGGLEPLHELDLIFPVLHGTFGEDGTLQGFLDLAEMPYVGAGVLGSAVAMDKGLFKHVMRANRIPIVDWVIVLASQLEMDVDGVLQAAEAVAPYPLFTKPANLGSSVGVSKCESRSDLIEGMIDAARYDRRILIERGLDAREIEVSVLGNDDPKASIPGEIIPSDVFYSYKAKYIDDASDLLIPARIDEDTAEEARRLAVQAYKLIDCAGMARVDFLLDRDSGVLYLNEINTIPGFTRISMYPKLWEASGVAYPELVDRLIELAFERHAQKERLTRVYGGEA